LIDTWSELQTSTVEAVQAPTPNLFSFAEACFFFAVVLLNGSSDSGNEGVFSKGPLEEIDEEFDRAIKRSVLDAHAKSQGGISSSAGVPVGDTTRERKAMDVGAGEAGRPDPFEEIEDKPENDWQGALHHHTTHIYNTTDDNTGASDHVFQSPDLNLRNDSSVTEYPWHNISHGQVHAGVLHDAKENSFLSSLSRQFEPPTSPFIAGHSSIDHGYSAPHNYITNTTEQKKAIGIVYLTCSPHENVPAGEANIGIILTPEARGKGLARQATDLVLSWVFDEIGFHRVQAGILDNDHKDRAISMFTQL
jgi:RimJ/RimL family protein N-acetyltransferase